MDEIAGVYRKRRWGLLKLEAGVGGHPANSRGRGRLHQR